VESLIQSAKPPEYRNSQDVRPPTEAELREHLGHAAGWIFANRARVSTENNAMLWLFIREADRLSGDGSTLDPQRDGPRTGVAMRRSQSFRGEQ